MSRSGVCLVIPVPLGPAPQLRPQVTRLAGSPRLAHCLRAMLETSRRFDRAVVAVAEAHRADTLGVLSAREFDEVELVVAPDPGSRASCLQAGLDALPRTGVGVLVHDLARPLTSTVVRNRVIDALARDGGLVVPAQLVVDSVKTVDDRGRVVATVDRATLRSTQYPRGMAAEDLRTALAAVSAAGDFDEIDAALAAGLPISAVDGDPDGLVITDSDTTFADAVLACRVEGRR